MARAIRTLFQSFLAPVISTCLYFVVFGTAIGSKIPDINGITYGAFIIPGLIMLSVITESLSNAAFGIFMPKYNGTIYEILSAPISPLETITGYVGAAATKSLFIGLIILTTASLFVSFDIIHPIWMLIFLLLTFYSKYFCMPLSLIQNIKYLNPLGLFGVYRPHPQNHEEQ